MKMVKVNCVIVAVCFVFSTGAAQASFFEMNLKNDSLYTPGEMKLSMKLTERAKVEGDYKFRISVYVADTLMRKQVLPALREEPSVFKVMFPKARGRTDVRCRAELFINGQFIEAKEKPLTLWPPAVSHSGELTNKVIWVFDISGRLQKIFEEVEIETVDATFQAARDFGTPTIIFIGQYLDPNSMRVITDCLSSVDGKFVTVFLRQNQFIEDSEIEIPKENNLPVNIVCDFNSPLLEELNKFDIMNMVDSARYVKIKKQKHSGRIITSYVTEVIEDEENIYSYLLSIDEKRKVTIYCQLPVADSEDPRYGILLNNLIKFADKTSEPSESSEKQP